MYIYVLLALINGVFIGSSRTINGQLSSKINPFKASFCNHSVGFMFLTIVLLLFGNWQIETGQIPVSAYFGGVFGALFVAASSYVFPRLGAMKSSILVIAGQMMAAVVFDWQYNISASNSLRCLGVVIVLMGVYLSKTTNPTNKMVLKNETASNN